MLVMCGDGVGLLGVGLVVVMVIGVELHILVDNRLPVGDDRRWVAAGNRLTSEAPSNEYA